MMEVIDSLQHAYSTTKFWAITLLISGLSAVLLPQVVHDLQSSVKPEDTLGAAALLAICTFGIALLPFAIWQHVQRARFYRWLRENWSQLEAGVMHPEGYRLDLDTKLVKYSAVCSVILATVSFESRPYAYEHRSAGTAQVGFTLLSAIFGWWYFGGLDGVVGTGKALYANIGSKSTFTIRDLLGS